MLRSALPPSAARQEDAAAEENSASVFAHPPKQQVSERFLCEYSSREAMEAMSGNGNDNDNVHDECNAAFTAIDVTAGRRRAGPPRPAERKTTPSADREKDTTAVHLRRRRHRDPNNSSGKEPLTSTEEVEHIVAAEDEGWGSWLSRKLYNGLVMLGMSFYQIMQLSVKQQPVDVKVIEFTSQQYLPNPPTRAELAERKRERRRRLGLPEDEEEEELDGVESRPESGNGNAQAHRNPLNP